MALAAISLLADQAKRLKDELRAELQAEMNELGADRVKAELGDEVVAYITTSKPKFITWMLRNVHQPVYTGTQQSNKGIDRPIFQISSGSIRLPRRPPARRIPISVPISLANPRRINHSLYFRSM